MATLSVRPVMAGAKGASPDYAGQELTIFALAANWKAYVQQRLDPYLIGDVAEVGAGLGETTKALIGSKQVRSWTCIEPDRAMASVISAANARDDYGRPVDVFATTLGQLPPAKLFDTVIYIDVLEHIEHDRAELADVLARLRPGGRIVVLSPAYQFLYSEFDKAIGHFRRYTKTMLRALTPSGAQEQASFYLDSVGMMASAANKFILRQALPGRGQVLTWDQLLVPLSRFIDPLVGRGFGRSVVMVWRKDQGE